MPAKKILKIWKLSEDNLCRYCGQEEEEIMHLFWYCPDVAQFWHKLMVWLSEQGLSLLLSPFNVIWGFQEDKNRLLSTIVLLGKFFIFKKEENVNLESFIMFLKHLYLLSKIIAQNKGKPHPDVWQELTIIKEWDEEL